VPLSPESARRLREQGTTRAQSASLVCTLAGVDGQTIGTLTMEVGPLEAYASEERASLLRDGATMLAEAIPAKAVTMPQESRWEERGKSIGPAELAIQAVLTCDGQVLEEREFRVPVNGTRVVPGPRMPLSDLVASFERKLIEDALRTTYGNRARAARILQTTERILGYRIQQYGIDCAEYRR
jgi:transcriptional regulator with GAF, ATPase, and Fis domain